MKETEEKFYIIKDIGGHHHGLNAQFLTTIKISEKTAPKTK